VAFAIDLSSIFSVSGFAWMSPDRFQFILPELGGLSGHGSSVFLKCNSVELSELVRAEF